MKSLIKTATVCTALLMSFSVMGQGQQSEVLSVEQYSGKLGSAKESEQKRVDWVEAQIALPSSFYLPNFRIYDGWGVLAEVDDNGFFDFKASQEDEDTVLVVDYIHEPYVGEQDYIRIGEVVVLPGERSIVIDSEALAIGLIWRALEVEQHLDMPERLHYRDSLMELEEVNALAISLEEMLSKDPTVLMYEGDKLAEDFSKAHTEARKLLRDFVELNVSVKMLKD